MAKGGSEPGKAKDIEVAAAMPPGLVRALAWLRAHLHEPVRLDTLAQVAGSAPRTLETHFRQYLGATPLGWVRQMRLMRARRLLMESDGKASVTRVALDSGFTQLGRFAARYSRDFGETPSQTLRRARCGAADDIDDEALRLTWQALPSVFAVAPRQCDLALDSLAQAQKLAPNLGLAKALAAWCWSQRAGQHFGATPREDLARAVRLADEACALGPSDALTLAVASGAFTLAHRLDEADRLLERALAHDPLCAIAWLRRGWASAYYGDSTMAIRELQTALRLMPFEPVRHLAFIGIGCAHFAAERYDRAVHWVQAGVEASPDCFWADRVAAAAAVHAHAQPQARRIVRKLLRKDPSLTVAIAEKAWPFAKAFVERLADGLAVAGLPRS
jgi:AraC-like DNA-binding protein